MARFKGSEAVKGGYYFGTASGKLEVIDGNRGVLPGDATVGYVRVPVLAILALAPLMGLAFVLLVPFLGLAVLIEQGFAKARATLAARRMVHDAKAAAAILRRG